MSYRSIFIAFLFSLVSFCLAVPQQINYQGKLTDATGVALDGTYNLTFRLYNASSGGSVLWSETHSGVTITKGLFDVILGSSTPINLPFDAQYWLEIIVEGEIMSPRIPLTSVGYSFRAAIADSAASGGQWTLRITDGADTTVQTVGNWGIARAGNTLYGSADSTHINLGVSSVTGAASANYKYCTVGGGVNNTAEGEYSTVSGGSGNTATASASVIGGGISNSVSGTSSGIGSGEGNTANGAYVTIGGGYHNAASNDRITIGGGYFNSSAGAGATIAGGWSNVADGAYSAISGGYADTASNVGTFIGGGAVNVAMGNYSSIGGGRNNRVSGEYSAVAGGYGNVLSGDYSFLYGIYDTVDIDSAFIVGTPHIYFQEVQYDAAQETVLTIDNGYVKKTLSSALSVSWDTLQAYSDTSHTHSLTLTGDVGGSGTVSGSITTDLSAGAVDWDELSAAVQDSIQGDWVALSPASPQTDADATPAIYINKTGVGQLLVLQKDGTDRVTISNSGNDFSLVGAGDTKTIL
ncbi:hypothetical protein DRQ26_06285, partial [bacterium]